MQPWGFYAHKRAWVDAGQPVLEGMQESENPFVEEIKIDHKITSDDARGHTH